MVLDTHTDVPAIGIPKDNGTTPVVATGSKVTLVVVGDESQFAYTCLMATQIMQFCSSGCVVDCYYAVFAANCYRGAVDLQGAEDYVGCCIFYTVLRNYV